MIYEDFNYVNLNLKDQGQKFPSFAIVYDFHIIQKIWKAFHHKVVSKTSYDFIQHEYFLSSTSSPNFVQWEQNM